MEMKKQVMSFNEFINEAYRIINEEEITKGSIDVLKKLLGGGLGLQNESLTRFNKIIDRLDELNPSPAYQEEAQDFAQNITDYLNSAEKGIKIKQKGLSTETFVTNKYKWLVNGTVRTKGNPSLTDNGDLASGYGVEDDTSVPYPLSDIIKGIFLYNLKICYDITGNNERTNKALSNFGKKAKNKGASKFLTIDEASLNTDIIQIVDYAEETINTPPAGEYGFVFPIFTIAKIDKGLGEQLSKDIYTVVIPPTKNENTQEVVDLAYNSSGTNFFAENAVVIGEEGKASLNSILSEFNSISKIVVNGGASSKPTSRAGGNEKLAQDRMNAGIAALNQLKKDGVEQLKGAAIEKGKATVQSGAASESDPKNQQVSFVISGSIRSIDNKGEAKEVTIQDVDVKKADKVTFKKTLIYCTYDIA